MWNARSLFWNNLTECNHAIIWITSFFCLSSVFSSLFVFISCANKPNKQKKTNRFFLKAWQITPFLIYHNFMSCCLWSLFIRLILSCCFVHIFSLSLYQVVIIAPQCSWAFIVVFFFLYFSHLLAVFDSMSNLSAFISLPNSHSISILAALGSTWFVSQNMWRRTLQKTCFFSFREKGKVAKKQTPMMTLNFLRQFKTNTNTTWATKIIHSDFLLRPKSVHKLSPNSSF